MNSKDDNNTIAVHSRKDSTTAGSDNINGTHSTNITNGIGPAVSSRQRPGKDTSEPPIVKVHKKGISDGAGGDLFVSATESSGTGAGIPNPNHSKEGATSPKNKPLSPKSHEVPAGTILAADNSCPTQ